MHVRLTYHFPGSIEVEEHQNWRYGAPGEKRQKKKKPTKEQVENQNRINKAKHIRRLIKWNFVKNDYWITLTYRKSERPPDLKMAIKDLEKFFRKLREKYKKVGIPCKWILTTEVGPKGAIHHHLILNRIEGLDIFLSQIWKKGTPHIQLLYEQGDFRQLADYMVKKDKSERRFSRSRNLIQKKPKRKIILRQSLKKEPKPPKGYYLDKESYVQGINLFGYPYRNYTFLKVRRE